MPPEGRRAVSSRPEGGNMQPEDDIIWPVGGKFSSIPILGILRGRKEFIDLVFFKAKHTLA